MFRDVANGTDTSVGKGKAFGYLVKPFVLGDARLYADHLQGVMLADVAVDYPAAQKNVSNPTRGGHRRSSDAASVRQHSRAEF